MSNTPCVVGPPFSIEGSNSFAGTEVEFHFTFNNSEDQGSVLLFEWYLNRLLILDNRTADFQAYLGRGNYTIGGRILTNEGWSGVREVLFACEAASISGPEAIDEGESASFYVIALLPDGTTQDVTEQYTFVSTIGTFTGSVLTIPPNLDLGENNQATVTASRNGVARLTAQVTVNELNEPQSIVITGPDAINEGSSGAYHVIATYANGATVDLSAGYAFECTEGVFDANVLFIDTNHVYGDNRPATITASKTGMPSLIKQITIVDTTGAPTSTIEGPPSVSEGTSVTYSIIATYPDGYFETITNQYVFSSTIGVFLGGTLTVDTNSTPGDTRPATITAVKTGATPLTKQITVVDTTEVLGALVLDLYKNQALDVIAYIDNPEVTENHIAAHKLGNNIVPSSVTPANAADALILASDFISQPTLNWRFVFNIAKLVTEHPDTSDFTFLIKGRSNVRGLMTVQYVTKKFQSKMTLSGTPGHYAPSTIGENAKDPVTKETYVDWGADGNLSESLLPTILTVVYNAASKQVTVTPIPTPHP